MTKLVNVETGEVVVLLTPEAARKLTDEIKDAAEDIAEKLQAAYDGRAWAALNYMSWREYAASEFDMSQRRAYQLLDMARVTRALEAADCTMVQKPNERQSRELLPLADDPDKLAEVWKNTNERKNGKPTARDLRDAVADIVREEAEKHSQRSEDRAANRELASKAERAGLDMDDERMRQRGEFSRLCRDLAALPDPHTFIEYQGDFLRERHGDQAIAAHQWLTSFVKIWSKR